MSILNNSLLLGADAGAAGYQVSRSIRLNASDSAFLSRTPASAGNRKTWTLSWWMKRSRIGGTPEFIWGTGGSNTVAQMFLDASERLRYGTYTGEPLITAAVFRDPSAWYHCVFVHNTANSTAADRLILYVNGVRADTSTYTAPTQDSDGAWNRAVGHVFGGNADGGSNNPLPSFNGYLAEIHFVDGQALTPSSFAETNATTGQWVPKAYTGSYGTNGFRLDFSDNSAATATTLGKDRAGSNNWTPNNLSVTAGAGNDSLTDTPTSYGTGNSGGDVRGNYCTWNPLANSATLTNGNLDCANSAASWQTALSAIAVSSGKWFAELTLTTHSVTNAGIHFGIAATSYSPAAGNYLGNTSTSYAYRSVVGEATGSKVNSNSFTSYGAVSTQGDVVGLALDLDAGTLTFYKNGVSQGQAFSGISGTFVIALSVYNAAGSINFGQRPFAFPVSGFKALCDTNLPAPTIARPSTVFDTKLYTSNAGTLTVSGLGFSPDFAWLKSRGTAVAHALYDTVRGAGRALKSNTTEAEQYTTDGFVSFNSDGFTLGANVNSPQPDINYTGSVARVAWLWDAGSSTVTNTAGSISSQVRANASAGFSIVTYTGNLSSSTVGHGLGVAPGMIIFKQRSSSVQDWRVYHSSIGAGQSARLNTTAAFANQTTDFTAVSSTTFTLGVSSATNEGSMVAYCFAPVAGYSSFGSYTGNGSADGPFVFTGFRPRFVLFKRTDSVSSGDWVIYDTARDPYNVCQNYLLPNSSGAEAAFANVDYLSNGFKLKSTGSINTSGGTWIYAAFAEHPFQYARAR